MSEELVKRLRYHSEDHDNGMPFRADNRRGPYE